MNIGKEYEKVETLLTHFNCGWKELNRCAYSVGYDDLRDAYARFSWAKQKAYNYCKKLESILDGYGCSIPSRNSQTFTYNFKFTLFGVSMYAFITKEYNRIGFIGMDRRKGIETLAKKMNDAYIYHDMPYDAMCECETLIVEMLGKKNKELRKELEKMVFYKNLNLQDS